MVGLVSLSPQKFMCETLSEIAGVGYDGLEGRFREGLGGGWDRQSKDGFDESSERDTFGVGPEDRRQGEIPGDEEEEEVPEDDEVEEDPEDDEVEAGPEDDDVEEGPEDGSWRRSRRRDVEEVPEDDLDSQVRAGALARTVLSSV
jgi:hypothetical protein